jgi:hypothetical protein
VIFALVYEPAVTAVAGSKAAAISPELFVSTMVLFPVVPTGRPAANSPVLVHCGTLLAVTDVGPSTTGAAATLLILANRFEVVAYIQSSLATTQLALGAVPVENNSVVAVPPDGGVNDPLENCVPEIGSVQLNTVPLSEHKELPIEVEPLKSGIVLVVGVPVVVTVPPPDGVEHVPSFFR